MKVKSLFKKLIKGEKIELDNNEFTVEDSNEEKYISDDENEGTQSKKAILSSEDGEKIFLKQDKFIKSENGSIVMGKKSEMKKKTADGFVYSSSVSYSSYSGGFE